MTTCCRCRRWAGEWWGGVRRLSPSRRAGVAYRTARPPPVPEGPCHTPDGTDPNKPSGAQGLLLLAGRLALRGASRRCRSLLRGSADTAPVLFPPDDTASTRLPFTQNQIDCPAAPDVGAWTPQVCQKFRVVATGLL